MKKMIKLLLVCFIFLLSGNIVNTRISHAASAQIEISADKREVTVGEEVQVSITIDSATLFGDFEANLTYDDDILQYKGGPSIITGSSGFLKIADINVYEGDTNRKYVLTFEALKVGNSDISFSGRAMVYDYEDEMEMSVSSNIYTISVKAAKTASNNAYLKSLKISPSKLEPAFDKNIYSYSTIVENKVEKLVVEALGEDSNSIVKLKGNDSLKEGENKVNISVIAESGDVIEYTIDVFREVATKENEMEETPIITPGTKHGTFEVARIDGELFAVYAGKYKLIEPDSEVRIPDGFITTRIIISDISINVYAPKDNLESDFLLIYAQNELDEAGFYQYDRIERTMQRYVPDSALGFEEITEPITDNTQQIKDYKASLTKAAIIIALLSIICALLMVVMIRQFMKVKGYHKDDLD